LCCAASAAARSSSRAPAGTLARWHDRDQQNDSHSVQLVHCIPFDPEKFAAQLTVGCAA
jgi:hypothetical protein